MRNFEGFIFIAIIFLWIHDTQQKNKETHDQNKCSSNKQCNCEPLKDGFIKADCSRKRLKNIPTFFGNVTIIDLSHNEVQEIPNNFYFPSTLKELDFSVNKISRLDVNCFKNLSSLLVLNLMCNRLHYSETILNPAVFLPLLSLNTLLLHHNIDGGISFDMYPTAISELKALITLTLDGKQGAMFGPALRNLTKLTRVTISGVKGKCDITWLPEYFFIHTPFIEYLDLTGCNLLQMDKGLLQPLRQLNFLNISHNILLSFVALSNVTFDLQWTKIKVFDFTKIHCTYGPGTVLFKEDMVFLKNTSVETIIFDSNRFVKAEKEVITNLPKTLQKFSFRDNRMIMGSYVFTLAFLPGLRVVDGDNQYTSHKPFQNTNRFEFCNDWRNPKNAKVRTVPYLYPSRCTDRDAEEQRLKYHSRKIMTIPLPKNLSEIYFSNSGLQYPIHELHFTKTNSVTKIILKNNLLKSWIGPVYNFHKLIHLDLSYNFCTEISPVFLSDVPNLKLLNISNNILGFNFGDILPFRYLGKLKLLDFSFNRVQNLSENIFKNLTSLRRLHLQSNLLRDWQFDVGQMTQLKYLDLSNNQLTSIPTRIRNELKQIAENHTLKFKLHGNRFRCDCHNIDFIKWMIDIQRDHSVFVGYNTYSCFTNNETNINFSELSSYLVKLEVSCSNYPLPLLGLYFAIAMSTVLFVGISYKYRWRLRYFLYRAGKYCSYVDVRQPEKHPYDAFICYADEDEEFVKDTFMKQLAATKYNLELISKNDFTPGALIFQSIEKAVHNSRRIVIILTEDYINSEYCMRELDMIKRESIGMQKDHSMLYLVRYKDVPFEKIPDHAYLIMELIYRKTFINYPKYPVKDFYEELAKWIIKTKTRN